MENKKLLIANRGEIAVRIIRSAREMGMPTLAVYSEDDSNSIHHKIAEQAEKLPGQGAPAYLNQTEIIKIARENDCWAIHPGYGFLSENADFAEACLQAGLEFVGPGPEALRLFGDKTRALELAREAGIPIAGSGGGNTDLAGARAFMENLGNGRKMMLKAVAGGGGRGIRLVEQLEELEEAYERCASEARSATGSGELYVEEYIPRARHIEVQVIADREGNVSHLWERECSLQRRNQKLVEMAPASNLSESTRQALLDASLKLAKAGKFDGVGTFEFLVPEDGDAFVFMEANPRLQVEHTVTEETTGVDLVETQIRIAAGESLSELGLTTQELTPPRGRALQLRINMETMDESGTAHPSGGQLALFEQPGGPGIRVDTAGYAGYAANPGFDSLLAKLVVYSRSANLSESLNKAYRALSEFRIQGVSTNISFLQNLLKTKELEAGNIHTGFVDENMQFLARSQNGTHRNLYFEYEAAGQTAPESAQKEEEVPAGTIALLTPVRGRVLELKVKEGDLIRPGQEAAVLESMKMEHVVRAEKGGIVQSHVAAPGETIEAGHALYFIVPMETDELETEAEENIDLDAIRPDLQETLDRKAAILDAARPRAVAKRHKRGQRTARENIDDTCDEGSFMEYGGLALAAQNHRRSLEELIKLSPADGLVSGLGSVNGKLFPPEKSRCALMSYDYTVFMGTQGAMNHKKTDRLFGLVEEQQLPMIIFTEGGGGRPGDVDAHTVAGLDLNTFRQYAKLSGLVPRIGVVSGRCFAGNAALLGCSDIIIAARDATIGMGGPVMIKGGGLGNYRAEEVGPVDMQSPNGVIDIVVENEAEAVIAAKSALSIFQGDINEFTCADQRLLRRVIPENRLRAYDVREAITLLADENSFLELRREFAPGMITGFLRVEGRAMGLMANNPAINAGAIDADGADKAARFMQLCDAFDIPILSLCDTPGIMVGPQAEAEALVRHASRVFITAASLTVPVFTIVLRKGYGLGAMAMAGGGFHAPVFTVAWPTGEFGAMGIEGAIRTGFQKELAAIKDWEERDALFNKLVAESYTRGKALNMAVNLEIDDVIDPLESRNWITRGLTACPPRPTRSGKKRPMVDSW